MRHRSTERYLPALSLLGSLILLPACATQPDAGERPEPSATNDSAPATGRQQLEVIQLQHASAVEVAAIVLDLIRDARGGVDTEPPQAIANPRTNAVVVLGDEDERAHLRDLIAHLDVVPQSDRDIEFPAD